MDSISVSSHFVRALLGGAVRQGIDPLPLLQHCNIAPEVLSRPQARVSGEAYTRLVQTIWVTLQDEYMGFTTHKSKPGTFAASSYLVIGCHSLESVYKRAAAFYGLFDDPIVLKLSVDEAADEATLTLEPHAALFDPDHFFQESLLVIWHRFSCWLLGERIVLNRAHFNYSEPGHVHEYRHLFNCELHFDQPKTSLTFHRRYLTLPLAQDERTLKEFLKVSPADLLAKPDDHSTYSGRIRRLLGKDLSQSLPDFEAIASQLNVSPQTLRRRLKQENTSFQDIKDQMRRDVAIYFLGRHEMTINEIAIKVGFTEPSTFHRAFKKWTGLTPGEYRER